VGLPLYEVTTLLAGEGYPIRFGWISAVWPRAARPHMQVMSENGDRLGAAACPVCRKPVAEKFRPFCSRRCADVDLNRWLRGVYAVPLTEEADEDGTGQTEQEQER
jgi:endogenous inhibitor of DNA gyrase (YacG/DUF329 family)